jgi:hypothetical protein
MTSRNKRLLLFSPLLLIGAAVSWSIVERIGIEPCPKDRSAFVLSLAFTGLVALYFFAAYALAAMRAWLPLSIATLWLWQGVVLWPLVGPACSGFESRDPAMAGYLVRFAWLVGAIVVLALATTWAMLWRWRGRAKDRGPLLPLMGGAVLCWVLIGAGAYLATPGFLTLYESFGADLPAPTLMLFAVHPWLGLVAVPPVVLLALRIGLDYGIALLLGANVMLSALVFALFAPMLKLCSCV